MLLKAFRQKLGKVYRGMMTHPDLTRIAEIIFLASGKIVWTCMLKCFNGKTFESKIQRKKRTQKTLHSRLNLYMFFAFKICYPVIWEIELLIMYMYFKMYSQTTVVFV